MLASTLALSVANTCGSVDAAGFQDIHIRSVGGLLESAILVLGLVLGFEAQTLGLDIVTLVFASTQFTVLHTCFDSNNMNHHAYAYLFILLDLSSLSHRIVLLNFVIAASANTNFYYSSPCLWNQSTHSTGYFVVNFRHL